jgi:heterodisulfide reductase subunit B
VKLSFFPGCSFRGTAKEYGESTHAVMGTLGHELVEIPDWNCCGASSAHSTDEYLHYLLPLRNLVLAESLGLATAASACSSCYSVTRATEHVMRQGGPTAERLNEAIEDATGRRYRGTVHFVHPLEILSRPDELKKIRARVSRPLAGLRLVPYYGCYLSRPPEIVAWESAEQPVSMDVIAAACGADVRRWSWKVECCGGSLTMPRSEIVSGLVERLLSEAKRAGAEAIVTHCPMCLANLDSRQGIWKAGGGSPMPVFYYTELLAMAFELPGLRRWLRKRLVDPLPLLRSAGLEAAGAGGGR